MRGTAASPSALSDRDSTASASGSPDQSPALRCPSRPGQAIWTAKTPQGRPFSPMSGSLCDPVSPTGPLRLKHLRSRLPCLHGHGSSLNRAAQGGQQVSRRAPPAFLAQAAARPIEPPGLRTLTLAGSTPDASATSSSAAIRRILGLAGGNLNAACAQFHVWRPWRRPGPAWPPNLPGEGGHRCGQLLFPARRLIAPRPLEMDSPDPCPLSPADGAGHSPGSCRFGRSRTGQGGDSPCGLSDRGGLAGCTPPATRLRRCSDSRRTGPAGRVAGG